MQAAQNYREHPEAKPLPQYADERKTGGPNEVESEGGPVSPTPHSSRSGASLDHEKRVLPAGHPLFVGHLFLQLSRSGFGVSHPASLYVPQ